MYACEPPSVPDDATPCVCPGCGVLEPVLTLLTTWFGYYRCLSCGLIWSEARPGAPPAEGL
jgi:hypothetical protein